jgi:hypothetical protein
MKLDNVTLVSVVGHEKYLEPTVTAMLKCMSLVEFKKIKLLSTNDIKLDNIEVIKIPTLTKEDYARFCLYKLPEYIDTDYCLTMQHDGFIIDINYWDNNYLKFDYIGSPWLSERYNNVGNGGFSLRSQKFLHSAKTLEYNSAIQFQPHIPAGKLVTPEDWFACNYSYRKMLDMNVRFADILTAYKFAVEHPSNIKVYDRDKLETYHSFGFHGDFNIAAMKTLEKK